MLYIYNIKRACYFLFFLLVVCFDFSFSQVLAPNRFLFEQADVRFPANDITDILINGSSIFFGTSKGLSVTDNDGGSFSLYSRNDGLGKGGISAVGVLDGVIWIATAFDSSTSVGNYNVGGGLQYSDDNGATWNWIPQPVDALDDTADGKKPTTVAVQNVTYDLAFRGNEIWIASWAGGLRKSSDSGLKWEVVTPDNFPFDVLKYLNHRAFSVISAANGLWVGTSGGINKSTDGGNSWTNYTAQNGSGISGNFVVALGEQQVQGNSIIWAATWQADSQEEYNAVSITENGGLTWKVVLSGEKAHNFAFNGNEAYVAADNGLFKSVDFGDTWAVFPHIKDESGSAIYTNEVYSAGVKGIDLWVGTADGLAKTNDRGITWNVFRAYQPAGVDGEPETYAYPNPFSPSRHNVMFGEGNVRIQYRTNNDTRVTIRIFDFGMNLVKSLVEDKFRQGGIDACEVWNGRGNDGRIVANGVYFYKLEREGEEPAWGKIVVLN